MIYDNIVIGSGISALGCVVGLLESNKKILCIDGSDNTLKSFKNIQGEFWIFLHHLRGQQYLSPAWKCDSCTVYDV